MTLAEFAMPLVGIAIGARFGRLVDWPFSPPKSIWPRRTKVPHSLSNGVFWAIVTCAVVSSGVAVIEHM